MIVITAKLVREQSSVFLSGEVVECFVSFTNPNLPEHRIAQSNIDILENLAWATCQIHCYCNSTLSTPAEATRSAQVSHQPDSLTDTSLTAACRGQGKIILATNPKILFCDLRLAPGETKSYLFKETLPLSCPPTYKGTYIRYSYKITVATQRLGSKVQALRVPIRVLPMPTIIRPDEIPALCNETNEELAPTNPFLEKRRSETKLEIALHHLLNITARRRPNFYLISNKRGVVGRFCLFKPAYKLGEDIVGTLDFSCRSVPCVQFSVTLQCEEVILGKGDSQLETGKTKLISFNKHHEVCLGLVQTQMILPIPLHVTPSFSTDLVDVRWQLHFEFVTTNDEHLKKPDPSALQWHAPKDLDIETMVWNLPVTLYPTSPQQIQQTTNKHNLSIK